MTMPTKNANNTTEKDWGTITSNVKLKRGSAIVQPSYFQAVKEFINLRWAAWRDYKDGYNEFAHFTTAQMRACIGHLENQTAWKRMTGNPNYLMHIYIGELRRLGALKRFGHGKYMIVAPIPEWFSSFHFAGLQGKDDDGSCFYWNDLPAKYKRNPWADTSTLPAVDDSVELRYHSETVTRIHEVTYLGDEYRVIHTYDGDDVYDEHWRVDNYVDSEITNTEIAEHLINWVKENCNQPTTLTNTTMKKKQSTKHEETLEKVNNINRIDQILATISSMEEELQALKSNMHIAGKGPKVQYDEETYTFTEEVFTDIIRTTIEITKEEILRSIRDGEVRIDQDAAVTLSMDSSNTIDIELEYDAIADYIDSEIEITNVWDTVTEQLADQFDLSINEDSISTPC